MNRRGGRQERRAPGAGLGSGFNPQQINGLFLWLRSDQGVTYVQGPVVATGTSPPAVTFSGAPSSRANSIVLTCTAAGTNTTATFSWTLNGIAQTPFTAAATVVLPGTGITATFPVGAYTNTPSADTYTSVVTVSSWADQSGKGNTFTNGSLLAPQFSANTYNGNPAISGVDGTRGLQNTGLAAIGTTGSIVMTFSKSSLASSFLLSGGGGGSGIIENYTTTLLELFLNSGTERDTIATTPSAGLHQVVVSQVDSVSLNVWYDGALVISKVPAATINVAWNTIFGNGTGANGTNGDFVELLEYAGTAVNASQAAQLHAHSQGLWGSP